MPALPHLLAAGDGRPLTLALLSGAAHARGGGGHGGGMAHAAKSPTPHRHTRPQQVCRPCIQPRCRRCHEHRTSQCRARRPRHRPAPTSSNGTRCDIRTSIGARHPADHHQRHARRPRPRRTSPRRHPRSATHAPACAHRRRCRRSCRTQFASWRHAQPNLALSPGTSGQPQRSGAERSRRRRQDARRLHGLLGPGDAHDEGRVEGRVPAHPAGVSERALRRVGTGRAPKIGRESRLRIGMIGTMTITLTPEQQRRLEAAVAAGQFASVEEAVRWAVDHFVLTEADLGDLSWAKPYLDEARESIARGESVSPRGVQRAVEKRLLKKRVSLMAEVRLSPQARGFRCDSRALDGCRRTAGCAPSTHESCKRVVKPACSVPRARHATAHLGSQDARNERGPLSDLLRRRAAQQDRERAPHLARPQQHHAGADRPRTRVLALPRSGGDAALTRPRA